MNTYTGLDIVLALISSALTLATILFFLVKAQKSPLLSSFLFYQVMVFLWPTPVVIHNSLNYFGNYDSMAHYFGCQATEHLVLCFTGAAWLIFCLFYTNHRILEINWLIPALISLSAFFFILSMLKRYNSTMPEILNEVFLLTAVVLLSYILAGVFIIVRYSLRQQHYLKRQALLLILGISIPLTLVILNAYYKMDGRPVLNPLVNEIMMFDIVPIGFSLSSLIFALATFKFRFMDIVPVALQKAFNSMQDCIVIVNAYGRIQYFNNAFAENFNKYMNINESTINEFLNAVKADMAEDIESLNTVNTVQSCFLTTYSGFFSIHLPEPCHFSIKTDPVYLKKNELIGSVLTISDITAYKSLLDEVKSKYRELETANRQLKEYALISGELAAVKERNRVARDIHDSLGHTMTLLISLLEVSYITSMQDPEMTRKKILQMTDIARDGLQQIKRSISGITSCSSDEFTITDRLKALKEEFKDSGVNIDFSIYGEESPLVKSSHSEAIFRICQEGLTNSIRHGKAKNIIIMMKFTENCLKLFFFDDGTGCKDVKKGFGLAGMEQRVSELNGTIEYGSDGEKGFNIHVEMPLT